MSYTIEIRDGFLKTLKKIPKDKITKVLKIIEDDSKLLTLSRVKIVGTKATYRVRIGDYRLIFEMKEKEKRIEIIVIEHRKDVYKGYKCYIILLFLLEQLSQL